MPIYLTILRKNDDQIVTHPRAGALGCGAAGVAAGAAGAVYVNALRNPFVYDDYHTVVTNRSLERLGDLRAIVLHDVTRPLVNLSYAIDRSVSGASSFGFHLTNVLLHALNVGLLFAFARGLYVAYDRPVQDWSSQDGGSRGDDGPEASGRVDANSATLMAFAAAAVFAVHPMMTEAVGYVSGRSELLCATFFLLAMLAGRRWLRGDGHLWAAATLALWAGALMSKEIGAMFPFALAGCDALTTRASDGTRRRRWKTVHAPLIGLALAGGLVRVAILTSLEAPGSARIHWPLALVALDVVRRYAMLLVSPRNQTLFHAVPPLDNVAEPAALLALASIAVLIWFVWSVRSTAGIAAFGVLWFLLLLVPGATLTIFNQGEPMAEHRVYLASCGLFFAAGDGIGRLRAWAARTGGAARAVVPALLAVVAAAFAVQTSARNAVWRHPVSLWREAVDLAPTHYRPRLLLGEALQNEGRPDAAIEEYKTAIQLRPNDPTAYNKLGAVFASLGRLDEARQEFAAAVKLDPQNERARLALKTIRRAEPREGGTAGSEPWP